MYTVSGMGSIGASGMGGAFGGFRGYAADNQTKLYKNLEARLGKEEAMRYTGVTSEEAASASSSATGTAKDARNFVQNYSKNMTDLRNAANDLLSAEKRGVTASSSNGTVVEGAVNWRSATPATYEIEVSQIAKEQISSTKGFDAFDENTVSAGQFKLSSGKGETVIEMSKYAGAGSNKEALDALAKDINNAGLGVTASTTVKDGKVSLELKATETGAAAAFEATGSFGVSAGLSEPKQAAQDAMYKVDGKEFTAGSNKIQIDTYKVDVTLKGTGNAKLTVGADPGQTANKVETLVKQYNDTLKFLNDNYAKGGGVIRQMSNMLHLPISEDSLKTIGVTVGKDGTMSVDKAKLTESLRTNPEGAKELISGSYSLAQGLMNDANQGLSISSARLTEGMRPPESEQRNAIKQQFGGYTYGRSSYQTMLNYANIGSMLNTLI